MVEEVYPWDCDSQSTNPLLKPDATTNTNFLQALIVAATLSLYHIANVHHQP
jgi:hypothetical protein